MELAKISATPTSFTCAHCGATTPTNSGGYMREYMRAFVAFEKLHQPCAQAAKRNSQVEQSNS